MSTEMNGDRMQPVADAGGGGGITELTGDVTAGPGNGSQAATVEGLQGNPVDAAAPAPGDVLTWDGASWAPAAPALNWTAYWVPDPSYWEDTGVTAPARQGHVWRDGANLYMFGGNTAVGSDVLTDIIYSATDDGAGTVPVFADSGATLPATIHGARVIRVGASLYTIGAQGGGGGSTVDVWTATLAAPLVWTDTACPLPGRRDNAAWFILGSHVYVAYGYDGSNPAVCATVAALSSFPTPSWAVTGALPVAPDFWEPASAAVANRAIVYGGYQHDPTLDVLGEAAMPTAAAQPYGGVRLYATTNSTQSSPEMVLTGPDLLVIGGNNTRVDSFVPGRETAGATTVGALPGSCANSFNATWIGRDGRVYIIAADKHIYRSGRRRAYASAAAGPTSDGGILGQFEDGTPTSISAHVLTGNAPWKMSL